MADEGVDVTDITPHRVRDYNPFSYDKTDAYILAGLTTDKGKAEDDALRADEREEDEYYSRVMEKMEDELKEAKARIDRALEALAQERRHRNSRNSIDYDAVDVYAGKFIAHIEAVLKGEDK